MQWVRVPIEPCLAGLDPNPISCCLRKLAIMGLFDQIVSAIDDPTTLASADQLGSILNTVQELSDRQGNDATATQVAMGVVGKYVRSALQSQQSGEQAQTIVNQWGGTSADANAVSTLFSEDQQRQIVQEIADRTGLDAGAIQGMLPMLVPLVLNLLKSGNQPNNPQQESNTVLNAFLDSDGDGDVDIVDALGMAGKFLGR